MKWLEQYPKEVKGFLVASLVASAGGSLMWPLTTMYVFDELGRKDEGCGFCHTDSVHGELPVNSLAVRCTTGLG